MRQLGILGSTRGTNLITLMNAVSQNKLQANIKVVISNKIDSGILSRAQENKLPAKYIDSSNLSREEFDEKVSTILTSYQVDLIVLIGYMRILSNPFVAKWRNKIINVHPSLLPAFKGGMDMDVHQAVLNSGATETGCTVHQVTEVLDEGPIIIQKKCLVLPTDSVESLKSRVQALEGEALIEVINQL